MVWRAFLKLLSGLTLALALGPAAAQTAPLRIAVYDVAPYGHVERNGVIDGASVELWRRVAEALRRDYRLIPVGQMEALLSGLEHGEYDLAVGAITITPERLARVDFSYPAHRSGVGVALRKSGGASAAFRAYAADLTELAPLLGVTLALLFAMGIAVSVAEVRRAAPLHESAIASWRDGVYWAVVTMTTVGYGDKTPKTVGGRFIAMAWMLASVALVSLLSTTLVSKMTADRVAGARLVAEADLLERRLAAVEHSSGAEFLDERRLGYARFADIDAALTAVARDEADAVVNSIGALQFAVGARFRDRIELPSGVLAPAYMAFALPQGSALKKPLDRALVTITAGAEWRRVEASYFAP